MAPKTSEPIICRLSRQAARRLAEIDAVSNRPPWPHELFESEFDSKHSLSYGIRISDTLIGFLVIHIAAEFGHIVNFAIDMPYRKRSFGLKLLREVLKQVVREGVTVVTLEVRPSNEAAISLYEKCGFESVGKREHYYSDDKEDAVVMKLELQPEDV